MRQLRFIFLALITFLFVTSAVFLRRTVSVLLCGVLSFNSGSCYSFLDNYGKADAAAPPSSTVVTSKDFSVVQKDKQKIAGCLFGVCVNLPKIPTSIPSVPSRGKKEPIPPANPQSNVSLAGKWQSDWGPVEFNSDLTGHWNQGGGIGQIKDGTYEPQTRKLVFHYYQSWNDMNGTATLTLSEDGTRLSGTWTQQRGSNPPGSGGSGGWTMTRSPSNEIAKPPEKGPLPEVGDILIYKGKDDKGNYVITHSGVITAVRPDGAITQVKSKWGGQGLYLHDPNYSVYGRSWTVWRARRKDGSSSNLLIVHPTKSWLPLANGYYTDKGRLITTFLTGYAENGDPKAIEEYIQTHKEKIQMVEPPTTDYNCHGFTFTGGRQAVPPWQVNYILEDNEYFQIKARDTDGNPH